MQKHSDSDVPKCRTIRTEEHHNKLPRMERHELQVAAMNDAKGRPVDQVVRIDQDGGHRCKDRPLECWTGAVECEQRYGAHEVDMRLRHLTDSLRPSRDSSTLPIA
jgi:hypothetical protein